MRCNKNQYKEEGSIIYVPEEISNVELYAKKEQSEKFLIETCKGEDLTEFLLG